MATASIWSRSPGLRYITMGWTFFIAENLVMSENRSYIIDSFGDDVYHGVYNSLSTAACVSILFGYFKHGRGIGPVISRQPGRLALLSSAGLRFLGLAGFSQLLPRFQIPVSLQSTNADNNKKQETQQKSINEEPKQQNGYKFAVRCPMDFKPRDVPSDGIYGLERISRHASLWSFGFVCAAEAVRTIYMTEIAFFSFPLLFAAIGTTHQDSRFRRGMGGVLTPERENITSNIPFAALVMGKQSWSALVDEIKWVNVSVAALAALPILKKLR